MQFFVWREKKNSKFSGQPVGEVFVRRDKKAGKAALTLDVAKQV